MDDGKVKYQIGANIAAYRKRDGLTQASLAEKLNYSDKAVSKWERGLSLPDASLMLELCDLLQITVNDLLSGEVVSVENTKEASEKNLVELVKLKEASDKRLLTMEVVIGLLSTVFLFVMVGIAAWIMTIQDQAWIACVMIGFGFAQFLVAMFFALKIEQTAGYYECKACGHRYVPSYSQVVMAPHMARTRHMKCPVASRFPTESTQRDFIQKAAVADCRLFTSRLGGKRKKEKLWAKTVAIA